MDKQRGIIFPCDAFNSRTVDEAFQAEADIVKSLNGDIILMDHTELLGGSFISRTRFEGAAFYRGWMMDDKSYERMEAGFNRRSVRLLTSAEHYGTAYYFHGWYETFKHLTPRSVWFAPGEMDYQKDVVERCGVGPYFVKDSVKSRKHEWATACYSPTIEELPSIVQNLLSLQSDATVPFIVVREFENFRADQGEVRIWWVEGKPVLLSPHPDTPSSLPVVDASFLEEVGKAVQVLGCPFTTTDVAQLTDGRWRVIEVSDGQVSGLPVGFDSVSLFKALLGS
ncbi:MAG: ATP-grasp domain-containing protein [Enterococcus sp.]|nr:ATP-grasp domain-containing protein [Enterococcus sp.]